MLYNGNTYKNKKSYDSNLYSLKTTTGNVSHKNHALERWNERVRQPYFNTKGELDVYVQDLIDKRKIEHIKNDIYLINDDIVAVLDVQKDYIFVVTYLGRQSKNPILADIDMFLKYRKRYGKMALDQFMLQ